MEQFHWDMAASIQKVTEEIVLRMVRDLHARTGMRKLCMAGGVALNCVANGRIVREGPFEELWVQPAAGDAGGALGAALFALQLRARQAARLPHGPRLLGPGVLRRGDPHASSTRAALPYRTLSQRRDDPRDRALPARGAGGGRLAAGPHGVGTALARRRSHPRRRAQPRELAARQSEDQVPRELPALRAGGAGREGVASGSRSTARARTCCWSAR